VAGRVDLVARVGRDGLDALLGEHLVELLQRRLDAGAQVAPLLLVERAKEVVADRGDPLDELLGGALADLVLLALGALLVVAEVRLDAGELARQLLDFRLGL